MTDESMVIEHEAEPVAPPSNEPETVMEVEEAEAVAEDAEIEAARQDKQDPGNEGDNEQEIPEQTPEIEYYDQELDGQTYKLPVAVQKSIMQEADYTRKSQVNAELQRSLEQQQTDLTQSRQVSDEEMGARAQLVGINQQLDQFDQFGPADWNAFEMNDPAGAQTAFRERQDLRDKKAQLDQYLGKANHDRTQQAEQETATRLQKTREYASTQIKGWTPEIDKQVEAHAIQELGFAPETLKGAYSPEVYRTLHLAMLGSQLLKAQSAPPPKKKGPSIKPLQKVAAKSGTAARKTLGEMSMDEYADQRNRQEAAKRKRATR